ncbi:MAG TPA: PKD domain-containing protein [Longimicrobiales bacterium]|jgi:PKD repeat protein
MNARRSVPEVRAGARPRVRGRFLSALLLIPGMLLLTPVDEQIVLAVGDEPTAAVLPGGTITIPINVDMSQAGGLDLASLSFEVAWDPDHLSFSSATPGSFGTVNVNEDAVASGILRANLFDPAGTTSSFVALGLTLNASTDVGLIQVGVTTDAAGTEMGQDITGNVADRHLSLCVREAGLSGDVMGPGDVNVIDAQQIARWAIGLPVLPEVDERMPDLADVTGDGNVNIIDAQQVARYSVGLEVFFPIGEMLAGGCGLIPYVEITSPGEGHAFADDQAIDFAGWGEDPEDGPLSGASLVWQSDLDGEIGTGESFSTSPGELSLGTHTITLWGWDSKGLGGYDQRAIQVVLPPEAHFTVGGALQAGLPTTFDGSASVDPNGGSLRYHWDFGDGDVGGAEQMAHLFTAPGAYEVTLTVISELGVRSTATSQSTEVEIAAGPGPTGLAEVRGRVDDQDGNPLEGVQVHLVGGGPAAVSGATGSVLLPDVPTGIPVVLDLEMAGYALQRVRLDIPAGNEQAILLTRMKTREEPYLVWEGGAAWGADRVFLSVPQGALVNEGGAPVVGEIQYTMTPIQLWGGRIEAFPGSFVGVMPQGEEVLLRTFGAAEFLVTQEGEDLQLAPGVTAIIHIPISADGTAAGEQIPLWYLDEEMGVWIQDGMGTVQEDHDGAPMNLVVRAEVTHLSWWSAGPWVEEPYEPLVRCELDDATPIACDLIATTGDLDARTRVTEQLPVEGENVTFPPDVDVQVHAYSIPLGTKGAAVVNGPGGGADEIVLVLDQSAASPNTSAVTVSSEILAFGSPVTVTLQARDEFGFDLTTGGDGVGFGSEPSQPGQSFFRYNGEVTDHGDGTYTTLAEPMVAGTPVQLRAGINGRSVSTPMPFLQVVGSALAGEDVEQLLAMAVEFWWKGSQTNGSTKMATTVMADQATSSWGNSGMYELSWEPRTEWDNSPDNPNAFITLNPWMTRFIALSALHDALAALDDGVEVGGPGGPDNARARAFGKLIQGLAHGWLALHIDQAFILDETVDVNGSFSLEPFGAVMDAALAELAEAIAVADANVFSTRPEWFNGVTLTNTELSRLAHSFMARFMASVARTPAQREAVDWAAVTGHVDQGILADFGPNAHPENFWWDAMKWLGSNPTWFRGDYKTIGGVYPDDPETDKDGSFANWMATPLEYRMSYSLNTDDQRLWDGTWDGDGFPNSGTDFRWIDDPAFRWDRGTYHFSSYYSHRYENPVEYTGPLPIITVAEMNLLKAEALYRLGLSGVADLVNLTRVDRGGLSPATDGDPHLFDMLAYEKRIETFNTGEGIAWFDRRGWGDPIPTDQFGHGLVEGTLFHFPVPGAELERLGLPYYTFGGEGPLMVDMLATAASPYGMREAARQVPVSLVYAFEAGMSTAEKLAAARAIAGDPAVGSREPIRR